MLSETKIITSPINVSANATEMGRQTTDQLLLIGHADGVLNDPQRPTSAQDAIDLLGDNPDSPLLRAFFEAYHAGARDIILCPAAPMSEWVEPASRTAGFYTLYWTRLNTTYNILQQYDYPDIVVPVEAVFHDFDVSTPDFLTQLITFLGNHVAAGKVMFGLIGVRGTGPLTILSEDVRLNSLSDAGKYVGVVTGEGIFDFTELNTAHHAPISAALAGVISQLPLDISPAGRVISSIRALSAPDRPDEEIAAAAQARLIPAKTTVQGKRGAINQVTVATDNSLAPIGSDFAQLSTLRMAQQVSEKVRSACMPFLGESRDAPELEKAVQETIDTLTDEGAFKSAKVAISTDDPGVAVIDLTIQAWFSIRQVSFQVTVGDRV